MIQSSFRSNLKKNPQKENESLSLVLFYIQIKNAWTSGILLRAYVIRCGPVYTFIVIIASFHGLVSKRLGIVWVR